MATLKSYNLTEYCNSVPVPCEPVSKNITNDLINIGYALNEIEGLAETILCKIDGGKEVNSCGTTGKNPECISEQLEVMKSKSERIFHRLDQINSFI
jgi:hypothetical protein